MNSTSELQPPPRNLCEKGRRWLTTLESVILKAEQDGPPATCRWTAEHTQRVAGRGRGSEPRFVFEQRLGEFKSPLGSR
jgi:hypothetical protein